MRGSTTGSGHPSATYRFQLTPRSGFDEARRRLPYLRGLGVDTLYLSPVFAARHGSGHGYDGVDPSRIDASRGGERSFRALARAARHHGLSLLVDFVPNHLATSLENPAWCDVLRNGRRSRFARLFDIDWDRHPDRRASVSVPWLDRPLADAFRDGTVAFERTRSGVCLRCGEGRLPVPPRAIRRAVRTTAAAAPGPRARRRGPPELDLAAANRGKSAEGLRLREALLSALDYRLVPWYDFSSINYRRFADIGDLIGVRSASEPGFRHLHRGLLRAVGRGEIDGVRVDHVDGIGDPRAYLRRLGSALRSAAPADRSPYIVVEKILARDEALPGSWGISGTTGYEVMVRITGVLLPRTALPELDRAYRRFCGKGTASFADEAYRAKRDVEEQLFAGDRAEIVRRLLEQEDARAPQRAATSPRTVDRVVAALTASLPVYRTYSGTERERKGSRTWLLRAAADAGRREPEVFASPECRVLLDRWRGRRRASGRHRTDRDPVHERWQQWTAAVAAKGIEDTAFYRYVRFLGANEVGGDPGTPGSSLREFHRFMAERARRWPYALTATSTHDSKWGEDARARFVALAEAAAAWRAATVRWHRSLRTLRTSRGIAPGPRPKEEYLVYQAWAATAPPGRAFGARYIERLETYLRKAMREAKEQSSWTHPDLAHEERVLRFVRACARSPVAARFRRELDPWVRKLDRIGGFYSLGQVVLRTTLPGVPDIYQGSEGWNHAMVDPDNRRPVRFDRFARLLARSVDERSRLAPRILIAARRGVSEGLKVGVTACLLRFRRTHRALFAEGSYLPLWERPRRGKEPTVAFARRRGRQWVVVAVGRGFSSLSGRREAPPIARAWRGRVLPLPAGAPARWESVLTGRSVLASGPAPGSRLRLDELFSDLPVAVLTGSGREGPAARRRDSG